MRFSLLRETIADIIVFKKPALFVFTLLAVFPRPPAGFDGALLHFLAHFHQPLVGEVWNYRQECASRHNPACACLSWSMCAGLTSTGTLFSSVTKWVKPPHGVFTSMWRTWSLKHFSGFTVEMFRTRDLKCSPNGTQCCPSALITDFSIWWRDGGRNNFLIDLKEIGQSSNCVVFFDCADTNELRHAACLE